MSLMAMVSLAERAMTAMQEDAVSLLARWLLKALNESFKDTFTKPASVVSSKLADRMSPNLNVVRIRFARSLVSTKKDGRLLKRCITPSGRTDTGRETNTQERRPEGRSTLTFCSFVSDTSSPCLVNWPRDGKGRTHKRTEN